MSTVVPRSGFAAVSNGEFRDENPSFSSQSNPPCAQHIQGNFLSTRPFHVTSMSTCLKTQDTVSTLWKSPAVLWLTVNDKLRMIAGFLSEVAIKLFRFFWSCVSARRTCGLWSGCGTLCLLLRNVLPPSHRRWRRRWKTPQVWIYVEKINILLSDCLRPNITVLLVHSSLELRSLLSHRVHLT